MSHAPLSTPSPHIGPKRGSASCLFYYDRYKIAILYDLRGTVRLFVTKNDDGTPITTRLVPGKTRHNARKLAEIKQK